MPQARKPATQVKKPTAKKQPVAPVAPMAPAPSPTPMMANPEGLPVIYDKLEIAEYSTTSARGPLTAADCATLLGWETEEEYVKRKLLEEPGSEAAKWSFKDPATGVDIFHCKDVQGRKVRCNNNAHNRPFDQAWCEDLVHTVLHWQWAGPMTIPGETINGETIRISRYGRVLSGQHQMTACKLADEWLAYSRTLEKNAASPAYPAWDGRDHTCIETILVTGMSEDPRVLMTIDYVKPRSAADVFYTSDAFRGATPPERKELCRMLAAATDMLWVRTNTLGYKTHPELIGFLDRHKRLLAHVSHLFELNSAKPKRPARLPGEGDGAYRDRCAGATGGGRRISRLRLSAGQCAALAYVMASAGPDTDGDTYRNEQPAPGEKGLDWSYEPRALAFWDRLADPADKEFDPVRLALGRLYDSDAADEENPGMGGRLDEKLAIIAKAWEAWKDDAGAADGPLFDEDDLGPDGLLCLSYSDLDDKGNKLPDGRIKLLDMADLGGIDGPAGARFNREAMAPASPEPPPPSREEIEAATEQARQRREAARDKVIAERRKGKK